MNLPAQEARLVRSGRKRRIWLPAATKDGRRKRCLYRAGERYRITGHDFSIYVVSVELSRLGEVDLKRAREGGHRTGLEMREQWIRARDRAWVRRTENAERVKRLEWLTHDELVQRWCERWADVQVWDIVVRPVVGTRLLHKDSSHGYTSNPTQAMRGEPEAITEEEWRRLQKREQAEKREQREREQVRQRRRLDKMSMDDRIRWIADRRWTTQDTARQYRRIMKLLEPDTSASGADAIGSVVSSRPRVGTYPGSGEEGSRLDDALRAKLNIAIKAAEDTILQAGDW